jgi:cellulose synthase/poly-beta-1,6-N-acetylglucosamine synthase-like glycosyltransferase/peptidoglycan/xylan/chitin deacetylase (PgdA/CDA1 family)/spore germination protein YaaH
VPVGSVGIPHLPRRIRNDKTCGLTLFPPHLTIEQPQSCMANPVFYDPQLKRWRNLRLLLNVGGLVITLIIVVFTYTALRSEALPQTILPEIRHTFRPIRDIHRRVGPARGSHRKTTKPPSEVPLNADEGLRAAFYVNWDKGSYSSLKEYLRQIDLLYPEWLHVVTPDGRLQGVDPLTNQMFDVVRGNGVHPVDTQVMSLIHSEKADLEVFPLVNNNDPASGKWVQDIGKFFDNPDACANFRRQLLTLLASDSKFRGVSVDFEDFPRSAQPGFNRLIGEMASDLHARGLKMYINVPADDDDFNYKYLAANSDGLILMDYDEHQSESKAGPVASQTFFVTNIQKALKAVPRDKLIVGIGNYGYEWGNKPIECPEGYHQLVCNLSVQDAWIHSSDSDAPIDIDPDSLNPHFAYDEEDGSKHEVWFLDAATAINEMRAARNLGIRTFALWRLGSEDRSLWEIWDKPRASDPVAKLANVPPGPDVSIEGDGEILRITHRPAAGSSTLTVDPKTTLVTAEHFTKLPTPYELEAYGYQPKKVAITFDDGPDPAFTPQILDVLKKKNAKATFFLIGIPSENDPGLVKRIYDEGHEIGNHTLTHPNISEVSPWRFETEINVTERLFGAKLGIKPLYFRPPYSIDQEPDTNDEVLPLQQVQDMGYITVGDKIDPNDWELNPRPTAQQIVDSVYFQLEHPLHGMSPGSIILLHDGGGDRTQTVKALPMMIDGLRARGHKIVPVAELIGKTRAEVMPPLSSPRERWAARVDNLAFWMFSILLIGIQLIFFLGDILMSGRLLIIGALATIDRIRGSSSQNLNPAFQPPVAVLIPAYNEEKVIERTVRSALASNYPKLRVIVIDDGSRDRTLDIARTKFQKEIAAGRVVVLTKPNSGKAEALNFGLERVTEDFYVGIDADTVIAKEAIARLIPHFADPTIGAVAGNAKVGNRVNIWTRWQALEYITSQNFERRALDLLGTVTVVPGALGAWRTELVRQAGGYHVNTVAEDADLTMNILRIGFRVIYEDRALAYTEAPMSARGLMRQRFRWSFGILQAVWKHRGALLHRGSFGWFALPNILIFQILLPLVSPFIDVMFVVSAVWYLLDRHFHPYAADPATFQKLVIYFFSFLVIDFLASSLAFALERRDPHQHEDYWLLADIWVQRFTYRQVFSVVLFKTLKRALDGRAFSWDKIERTAALSHGGGD